MLFQPSDYLVYLEMGGIKFGRKEVMYFWHPCLSIVQYFLLNKPGSELEWIESNALLWLSALYTVSLILIVRIGTAIVRLST